MSDQISKRELLRDKVVDLVKEFVKTEGGITGKDIVELFGAPYTEVAAALAQLNLSFS